MMLYHDNLEKLFFDVQHAGVLHCTKPLTVCCRTNVEKNKNCALYLACDKKGLITQVCFKALGDPYVIASFEWLCRQIELTELKIHPLIDYVMIVDALMIPKARYAAAVLVETNYHQAIHLLKQAFLEKNHE